MNSPFKFLDAYTAADSHSFFGRDKEEKLLYQQLRTSSIVLVYGVSGTGKTSLVQAGLTKFYDGPDWHPFFIRRGKNINESLKESLNDVLEDKKSGNLNEIVKEVYSQFLRPVYLIFDQFEEIFTLNRLNDEEANKERAEFFSSIQEIINLNLPCKIILLVREEFIGQLYEYEHYIPTLFDVRLRVEPMSKKAIETVVDKTFEKYSIKIIKKDSSAIVTNLLKGNATSQLAFLQVYLDKLWRTAVAKKHYETSSDDSLIISINSDTVKDVEDVNMVLKDYLEEQIKNISESLNITQEKIGRFLDHFVTDDGTKRPMEKDKKYEGKELKIVEKLIKGRLISDNKFYELAHDALAGIIVDKRTSQLQLFKNLSNNIKTNYNLYKNKTEGDEDLFLKERIVKLFEEYEEEILKEFDPSLRENIKKYIKDSDAFNKTQQNEVLKKKRRNIILLIAASLAIIIGVYSYMVGNRYKSQKEQLSSLFRKRFNLDPNLDKAEIVKTLSSKRNSLIAESNLADAVLFDIGTKFYQDDYASNNLSDSLIYYYSKKSLLDENFKNGIFLNSDTEYKIIIDWIEKFGGNNGLTVNTGDMKDKVYSYTNSKELWKKWKNNIIVGGNKINARGIDLNLLIFEDLNDYKNITEIDFKNCKFSDFPKGLSRWEGLTSISMEDNSISTIPKDIGELKKLGSLILNGNKLIEFPLEVLPLENLYALGLGSNKITKLPREIASLEKLLYLTLSDNSFQKFPEEIFLLPKLRVLYLIRSGIEEYPADFSEKLKKSAIEVINISGNALPPPNLPVYNRLGKKIFYGGEFKKKQ